MIFIIFYLILWFLGMVQICSGCNKTIPLKYTAYGDNGQPLGPPINNQPPPPTTSSHVTSERDIR